MILFVEVNKMMIDRKWIIERRKLSYTTDHNYFRKKTNEISFELVGYIVAIFLANSIGVLNINCRTMPQK